MRLGIIGPRESIQNIRKLIEKHFAHIHISGLEYEKYYEASDLAKKHQRELDALLFTGPVPYRYASKLVSPVIPWEYIPGHGSTLLTTLIKAIFAGYDIKNISFDSYGEILFETYEEIGIPKEELNIYVADNKIMQPNFLEYLYNYHKTNYLNGSVSCCITGLSYIYNNLCRENIPCLKILHTANIVRETVTKLRLKHLAHTTHGYQIVVLAVKIDEPEENSLLYQNEYQQTLNKIKVAEQVYLFAQKIQAAVIEVNLGSYLLFSTKSMLENETKNLQHFELLQMVKQNTSSTVSIGIGFGKTAMEAKSGALMGAKRAQKSGGNTVFVVYEGGKIVGPINTTDSAMKAVEKIDEYFLQISRQTGLSINTIFRLNSIKDQYKQDCFTTKELARLYGVTLRSMNRIIARLKKSGYIEVVGSRSLSKGGRPCRIVKLKF